MEEGPAKEQSSGKGVACGMDSYHENGNFMDNEARKDVIDSQFDVYEERSARKFTAH